MTGLPRTTKRHLRQHRPLTDASNTAANGFGHLAWTYDLNGNRQSETRNAGTMPYAYSPPNWLVQKGSETRSRTANGNTLSTSTASFAYDGYNRLVTSQTASETTTYTYNALGQRIKKINQNGLATSFHYGPDGELLYERDANGNTKAYVWLDGRPLARIDNDAQIYYYHVDHLGTPWAMTDASGTVVWKADYEPFGSATVRVSTIENNLRLPGQYYDRETGLHYNYFRDYDPTTDRYLEFDPSGLRGGLNGYTYANQNPLTFIDPLGLAGESPFGSSSSAGPPLGFPDISAQASQQVAKGIQRGINALVEMCKDEDDSFCEKRYQLELNTCRALGRAERARRVPAGSASACYSSAEARKWACENKRPEPPFSGWPQH